MLMLVSNANVTTWAELVVKEGCCRRWHSLWSTCGSIDGVESDGAGDKSSLDPGSGQFIPGFEDQLVGHSVGETVDVIVTFWWRLLQLTLQVKKEIRDNYPRSKSKEVPALDDELAKTSTKKLKPDELKENTKELAAAKEEAYNDAVEAAAPILPLKTLKSLTFQKKWSNEEVHRSIDEFLETCNHASDLKYQITEQLKTFTSIRSRSRKPYEDKPCGWSSSKAECFEATEEEINAEIEQLAADYNMPVEQVRNLLSPEMLKHDITVKKAERSHSKSKII